MKTVADEYVKALRTPGYTNKAVKPIDPRSQEWIETMRNTPKGHLYWPISDPALDHYKTRQAFEVDLILDAALDKAIEENDIQYIIKHKEREAAEKQAESLEFLADSLYDISLNYERSNSE